MSDVVSEELPMWNRNRRLDTVSGRSYKALAFAATAAVGLFSTEAKAVTNHGLGLPSGTTEVGENRFRSGTSWDETLKFFQTVLHGQPKKAVANIPGIKAVHYDSPESGSGWEGVNVYQRSSGEVRIFVIPRDGLASNEVKAESVKAEPKPEKKVEKAEKTVKVEAADTTEVKEEPKAEPKKHKKKKKSVTPTP